VAAPVLVALCIPVGSTATGIAEFHGGRAGFAVAYALFVVLMGFTTCACVQGGGFVPVLGFCGIIGCWF